VNFSNENSVFSGRWGLIFKSNKIDTKVSKVYTRW
jgi:hypothetical protein